MRNAILQLPDARTDIERRKVIHSAIRQLERAEIYIAAVEYMELGDREADRLIRRLRTDLDTLRAYLAAQRSGIRD